MYNDEHDRDECVMLTKVTFLWLGKGATVRFDCSMLVPPDITQPKEREREILLRDRGSGP